MAGALTSKSIGTSTAETHVSVEPHVVEHALREKPLLRGLCVSGAGFGAKISSSGFSKAWKESLLIYCAKGGGWCELEQSVRAVRRGDLVVLPSACGKSFGSSASTPWTVQYLWLQGRSLSDYFSDLGVHAAGAVLNTWEDPQVPRIFNDALKTLRKGATYAGLLQASNAAAYLLSLLIAKRIEASDRPGSDSLGRVAEAITYMSEHLDEPLRISALARLSSLSPAYFGELFKEAAGCSPREYLHLLRIHRACQLLRGTSQSVKEIAARVGYEDPFHFSRQFKAFQGLSPTEYRERKDAPIQQ